MSHFESHLLILASAGSGKTYQLGNRIIDLVVRGAEPEKIVALTFTRKAAGEFADSVLLKLAAAAEDPKIAARLSAELGLPDPDFSKALEQVVQSLPRLTLGTMDSFFSRVVRGFQYELGLTGGKFELLEGPRADAVKDELLTEILAEPVEAGEADEFLHGFRRATIGKEGVGVLRNLRDFVDDWQTRYRTSADLEWGPESLAAAAMDEWEQQKHRLAATILRSLDHLDYTYKTQRNAMEKMVEVLVSHTINSGILGKGPTLLQNVFEAMANGSGSLWVKSNKEFLISGMAGDALREMVMLAANCEMAAALVRTRALHETVAKVDELTEKRLRKRGLLGFDDVKILMGEWAKSEEARLRREAIDFRLDARHDHWLLDEFQDTSSADWTGLEPLIDESVSGDETTLFIVGDRKQAIYGWRGGEVGLFDHVMHRYSGKLKPTSMTESWRSCPEVLALVNQVCGGWKTMESLFGQAAEKWHWEDHISAPPLVSEKNRGHSRVEFCADEDARISRMIEILEDLGIGKRALSCGVLVRSNQKVREIADELRNAGFDVIEEGRREPSKDNPVGITLANLLRWLADPADGMASEIIAMSPLGTVLTEQFGPVWQRTWEELLAISANHGFAAMMEKIVEPVWNDWSDFGKRRAGDVISALSIFDAQGGTTPGEAADWIERLEVSQNPGIAAVQVMTIHKSKGLGFDVVLLPDVPNDSIPLTQSFKVAEGDGWLTQAPAKWARQLLPDLRKAEEKWAIDQQYEAFCLQYVALTRAKRGLYVLLELPAKSANADKPSLANWLARSIGFEGKDDHTWESGRADWVQSISEIPVKVPTHDQVSLGPAVPRRERISPSAAPDSIGNFSGLRFGQEVHSLMERVGWIDEEKPTFPDTAAGVAIAKLLQNDSIKTLLSRREKSVERFSEQPIEAIFESGWMSGVMDRLHLHYHADGSVALVEIIDFKTDKVSDLKALEARHSEQMTQYRSAMAKAFPQAQIRSILVSVHLGDSIMSGL
ncbi:UvrD-helicase domain-containing protein [Luteolibacter pohnpeiensis]|uniref:DNA 3'-5' helicase n=1 Tax=Luteolibacter pohnpeiensis TaxID=454153 RepID=A0A934S9Y0_9BACT|nr:UvrD-helicase domain-containing protein [Luteolibacter pohnpeiensis]MBK1884070.1 UvrD-helicase domain-containing protein [Luteolibacter pohnpeiensis]